MFGKKLTTKEFIQRARLRPENFITLEQYNEMCEKLRVLTKDDYDENGDLKVTIKQLPTDEEKKEEKTE